MLVDRRVVAAFVAAFSVALCLPGSAVGAVFEAQEVQNYKLSQTGLSKYVLATRNLAALPGACDKEDEDMSDSESLGQMAAKLDAIPGIKGAIQSAGMTTREYLVFGLSMVQNGLAAWAADQPGGKLPEGVSQANVDFYKAHAAELQALGKLDDACEQESSAEAFDE